MNKLTLTSGFTKLGLIIAMIFILVLVPVIGFVYTQRGFHVGMIFGGLAWLILFGIVLNLLLFNADARIEGDQVILKKLFGKEKSFQVSEISDISSVTVKQTKYTTVKFQSPGKTEKFLLINKLGFISVSNTDSEAILNGLRQTKK